MNPMPSAPGLAVTIAIPTFNRENFVRGAIESALANPRDDIEVLVIDNCSTDRTVEVARSYSDPRLKVVQNPSNLGLFGNFNRCLELASGRYLCILCSDDRIRPGFLDAAVLAMDAHPNVGLLTTQAQVLDVEGREIRLTANHLDPGIYRGSDAIFNWLWFQANYAYSLFNLPSGDLIRMSVARQVDPFPTTMKIVGDADFFCRLLENSDMAALAIIGCDTTYHSGQEVFLDYGDTSRVHEHYLLIERYRELLEQRGAYRSVLAQQGAVNTALAFKFWRLGNRKAAQEHWGIVQSKGIGKIRQFFACCKLVFLRATIRLFGKRWLPRSPSQALTNASQEFPAGLAATTGRKEAGVEQP